MGGPALLLGISHRACWGRSAFGPCTARSAEEPGGLGTRPVEARRRCFACCTMSLGLAASQDPEAQPRTVGGEVKMTVLRGLQTSGQLSRTALVPGAPCAQPSPPWCRRMVAHVFRGLEAGAESWRAKPGVWALQLGPLGPQGLVC